MNRRNCRRLGAALLVATFSTACGSTAQLSGASPAPDAGLGGSAPELPADAVSSPGSTSSVPAAGGPGLPGGSGPRSSSVAGSDPRGPASGTSTPGTIGTGPRTASRRAPLKIGITYIDNEKSQAALGVSSQETVTAKRVSEALVKAINARGGLAGRLLEPVVYGWESQSANWSQDASAACATFTQDNRVELVLDGAFGTTGGFGDCLQDAGVLNITRGPEGDRVKSRQGTLHVNTESMVYDRRYAATLTNLAATGYLNKSHQLGIMVEQCPAIQRAYNQTILPLITRLGLKAPQTRTFECTTSFASAGPAASAISSAVLAFREAAVDRVMFVSDFEDVALLLFARNADSQQYYPGYALTSGAQPSLFVDNVPEGQWPQLHGVGFNPEIDIADNRASPTPVESRCLDLAKSAGVTAANAFDRGFVYTYCGLFLLLEEALAFSGGDSSPHVLQGAINGLGTSFVAPGLVAGSTRFSSSRHDGPDAVRVFGYVPSCTCLRYSGPVLRAPE